MRFSQEVKEITVGGKDLWVDCRSWVDTWYRWLGTVSYTRVGSRVTVYAQRPEEFKDSHPVAKFFCSFPIIGWFCGLAAALAAGAESKKYWKPDRDIEISVRTTYYNRVGTPLGDVQVTCTGNASCGPKILDAVGAIGIACYPDFGSDSVLAVRTDGTVRIAGMSDAVTVSTVASAGPTVQ